MFAKSISENTFPVSPSPLSRWPRNILALVVFLASFSALALLLHDRYVAHWLESTYAAMQTEAATLSGHVFTAEKAPIADPDTARHAALAEFLAKRYKVSQDVTLELVQIAHEEGRRSGLDPLLIMAVIAIESRYNPIAESQVGAKGLMQIIPKYHGDKLAEFGGEKAVFDPESNIRVGTRILKEYLGRTGNLGIALQMYAGALDDDNDTYTNKVLGEKSRLQRVVAALAGSAPGGTPRAPQQRLREARGADSPFNG